MLSITAFGQQDKKGFSAEGRKITVYTTAENTDSRLKQTDNLEFKTSKQPLETEVSVFVNPNNTFQSFMGIGGAITDASAEIYAKTSKKTNRRNS